jgi:hypothetical protein
MMAGIRMDGIAESGYGVTIAGFHCQTIDAPAKLSELLSRLSSKPTDFTTHEENGYVTFVAASVDANFLSTDGPEVVVYRREPHKFFIDLPKFIAATRAREVLRMSITGSLGSLSLTLLYKSAPRSNV